MTDDFDAEFDALPSASVIQPDQPDQPDLGRLGIVVETSSKEICVLVDPAVDTEQITIGSYVGVEGSAGYYLCMANDVRSRADRDRVRRGFKEGQRKWMLADGSLSTDLFLYAHLLRPTGKTAFEPVKTVPMYLRVARAATQEEISAVFGDAHQPGNFHIGSPLDMPGVDLALNMRKLAQRSAGLFGQSGTGKSYLARMVLAGLIRDKVASTLIFDMHSEYGWQGGSEDGHRVKGLKQLFPQDVAIFTMDPENSRLRGSNPDYTVIIGKDEVQPEDIEAMGSIWQLTEPQIGAVYTMARVLGRSWLKDFLDDQFVNSYGAGTEKALLTGVSGLKALSQELEQPYGTMAALRRRFERFRAFGFLQDKGNEDVVDRLFRTLDAGKSVVLEFGSYGNSLDAYMFVANFLTRRIRARYEQRMNAAFGGKAQEPTPLVITIEEAHKFLAPGVVEHTTFGIIARELRKYNVTLFVIDQRPSQIDPEVMSQIATRITALLTDSNDVDAVLKGASGAAGLREVLSRLDTRQQALIMGHAVPMPVVVRTRDYNLDFYKSMGYKTDEEIVASSKRSVAQMRGPEDFNGFD